MKIQKRKDTAKSNRVNYTCALAVALILILAHKSGWIEISFKKPVTKVVSAPVPRKHGRSYYRSGIDRKERLGDLKDRRKMPGCETLCWSVEQWYRSVVEVLKAQELVRNMGDEFSLHDIKNRQSPALQNLEKEWNDARTNMRLRRYDGAHCLVFFGDKVEHCRDVVSGNISLYEDLEAAVKPVCRRYLHMAKEYEKDATECLKGSMLHDSEGLYNHVA